MWELHSDKILNLIKEGKRIDGRALNDYRKVSIQRNAFQNAEGSARVLLGETDVIVGVKFSIGEPYPDMQDEGTILVGAELLPLASPTFESGPPDEVSIELARVVDRGIRESKAIDFKKLCIKEGEHVFMVFIDLYAINYDGNLFDACSLGALASLLDAKIPKQEDGKIIKGEYDGKLKLSRKPLLSTFAKIGTTMVLDPSLAEEKAMTSRFSIATTEDDMISALQKGEKGSLTAQDVSDSIETAIIKTKELRKLL